MMWVRIKEGWINLAHAATITEEASLLDGSPMLIVHYEDCSDFAVKHPESIDAVKAAMSRVAGRLD